MKPESLTLSGWGPYRGVERVDFRTFQEGLFLVTGPTGSGKTTIFDGIAFALYGEVSGSVREKDSLRSDFAKPETATYVELEFLHKEKPYRIVRNPKYDRPKLRGEGVTTEPESGEMYQGGELLAAGSSQVTEAVKELLGLDYYQFKQISMIAQGEFQQLLVASSKERTQIFRDIFQTRLYDVMTGVLVSRTKQIASKAEEKKHRIEEITATFQIEAQGWQELLEKKNRNYKAVLGMAEMEAAALKTRTAELETELSDKEKDYKKNLQMTELWKLQNQQIAQYEKDCLRLEEIKQEKTRLEIQKKELRKEYDRMPKAGEQLEESRERLRKLQEHKESLTQWLDCRVRLEQKQKVYLELDEKAKQKKLEYEYQEDCHRKAAAGILARDLKAGMPCPVCGSVDHPLPAQAEETIPDEKRIKQLKQIYESAWQEASEAQNRAAALAGTLHLLEQQMQGRQEQKTGHLIQIYRVEEAKENLLELEGRIREETNRLKELEAQIARVTGQYQEALIQYEKVKSACEQMKNSLKPPKEKQRRDIAGLTEALTAMEQEKRHLSKEKERAAGRLMGLKKSLTILKKHLEEKEVLEQEYGIVREVERAASGYNNRNLVFEQYVLSVYFDDILYAANRRLLAMTGDRYELYRLPRSKDRRSKEGMELEVLDQYTGKKRSVRTLSGGESFKAALALALGTSDVVQSYAGGIRVETLFVDEGFGSLDTESLNQSIAILTALSGGSRMIGIISHVEELKEQIEHQIIIDKTTLGSSIRVTQ